MKDASLYRDMIFYLALAVGITLGVALMRVCGGGDTLQLLGGLAIGLAGAFGVERLAVRWLPALQEPYRHPPNAERSVYG